MPNQPQRHNTNDNDATSNTNRKSAAQNYMKYTGMAFQMGIIILIGTLAGRKLDDYFQLERPYLTVVFALFSIFAALYLSLKDLFRK